MQNCHYYLLVLLCLSFSMQSKEATKVTLVASEHLAFQAVKQAPAKTISLNFAVLPAELSAIVVDINFEVGDKVSKGEVIASLDCRDQKLILERLKTQKTEAENILRFNERELNRSLKLDKNKSISEAELDHKQTQVNSSQNLIQMLNFDIAQQVININRCAIQAPFDGVITERLTSISQYIHAGMPVVRLLHLENQRVSAQIASIDLISFNQANRYWFQSSDREYELKKNSVIPLVNDNSHSLEARLTFISEPAYIGSKGQLKWKTTEQFLPTYLLQKRNNAIGFFIADNNQARFIVVPSAKMGRPFPFLGGANFNIILDGRFSLEDNQNISIVTP